MFHRSPLEVTNSNIRKYYSYALHTFEDLEFTYDSASNSLCYTTLSLYHTPTTLHSTKIT